MKKKHHLTVAQYFTEQINLSGKSQVELAHEMGFDAVNVISNIKAGKTKLPLARIGLAAKALGVDALYLMKIAIIEYFPSDAEKPTPIVWDVFEQALGRIVTANELEIILALREINPNNPKMASDQAREKLANFANTLT